MQLGPAWLFDDLEIPDPKGDAAEALRFLSDPQTSKEPRTRSGVDV